MTLTMDSVLGRDMTLGDIIMAVSVKVSPPPPPCNDLIFFKAGFKNIPGLSGVMDQAELVHPFS